MTYIAILDDYLGVARSMADWESLDPTELRVFAEPFHEEATLVESLAPFNVLSLMRERTALPAHVLRKLPNLELIVTTGMNNSSVDFDAARERGIVVCGTPGQSTPMPELAWGLIISLMRDIPKNDSALRQGVWRGTLGSGLFGKRLGLIGLGASGMQMARIGASFGMEVVAWSPNLTPSRARGSPALVVQLDELLGTADIVSIHLRLGPGTRGLIGLPELSAMKRTAYLVNPSRGSIVDESALIKALGEGLIAGAGLDVYDMEPVPSGHPLLSAPNCVLTPHLGYVTRENFELFYSGTVEAIGEFLAGTPIRVLNAA